MSILIFDEYLFKTVYICSNMMDSIFLLILVRYNQGITIDFIIKSMLLGTLFYFTNFIISYLGNNKTSRMCCCLQIVVIAHNR